MFIYKSSERDPPLKGTPNCGQIGAAREERFTLAGGLIVGRPPHRFERDPGFRPAIGIDYPNVLSERRAP